MPAPGLPKRLDIYKYSNPGIFAELFTFDWTGKLIQEAPEWAQPVLTAASYLDIRKLGIKSGRHAIRAVDDAEKAVTHGHHAWPKYLGGPAKQELERLPKSLHDAYHRGLDKILPRRAGTEYYNNLPPAARQQMQRDLADYTRTFDTTHGTGLYDSMIRNGFPGS